MSYSDVQHQAYGYSTETAESEHRDHPEHLRHASRSNSMFAPQFSMMPDLDNSIHAMQQGGQPMHGLYPAPSHMDALSSLPHHHGTYQQGWRQIDERSMPPDVLMPYGSFSGAPTFHDASRIPPQSSASLAALHQAGQRLTLAGSLDPTTGIFYRTPEHPRLRTAQACEKCRTRKAKCSGEHPSCKRCITRGLICEYAKEGRVRGPNKGKAKTGSVSSPTESRPGSRGRSGSTSASTETESNPETVSVGEKRRSLPVIPVSLKVDGHRRNSVACGDIPVRTRPPNLRLDAVSNYYRRDNLSSLDAHTESAHFQLDIQSSPMDASSQPVVASGRPAASLTVDTTFLQSFPGHVSLPASALQTKSSTPAEEGTGPVASSFLDDSRSFSTDDDPYTTPSAFVIPQHGMTGHRVERNSIGALSFSSGTASNISSPITPMSSNPRFNTDLPSPVEKAPTFDFSLQYADFDQQQNVFSNIWDDGMNANTNVSEVGMTSKTEDSFPHESFNSTPQELPHSSLHYSLDYHMH